MVDTAGDNVLSPLNISEITAVPGVEGITDLSNANDERNGGENCPPPPLMEGTEECDKGDCVSDLGVVNGEEGVVKQDPNGEEGVVNDDKQNIVDVSPLITDSHREGVANSGNHGEMDGVDNSKSASHEDHDSTPPGVTDGPGVSQSEGTAVARRNEKKEEAKVVPKKRMTRAQKAIMESLASFGGSKFDSISVRKIDLHAQLKKEAEELKVKEKKEESGEEPPSRKRPRTRLQVASEESAKNFQKISLGEGAKKKYPKVTMAKINSKNSGTDQQQKTARYQTRVQRSRAAVMDSFGGADLGDLPVQKKSKLQSNSSRKYALGAKRKSLLKSKPKKSTEPVPDTVRRLTRVEKARMEAIQSFGGNSLNNILIDSKKKVSRTLNPVVDEKDGKDEDVAAGGGDGTESHDDPSESCDTMS